MSPKCIECGQEVTSLYINYGGPEKIRLTECPQCGSVADKYVEYDYVLIFLDMVLHKPAVYRHLLFNRIDPLRQRKDRAMQRAIGKLILLLLMFDVYVKWMQRKTSISFGTYAYLFFTSAMELFVFIFAAFIASVLYYKLLNFQLSQYKGKNYYELLQLVTLGVLISSFGKFVHILMVIWEYDQPWLVGVNILTSNAEAISVVLDCSYRASWLILAGATICKYLLQKAISRFIDPLILKV